MTAEVNMDTFLHAPPHKIRVQSLNPNRQMTQSTDHQVQQPVDKVCQRQQNSPTTNGRLPATTKIFVIQLSTKEFDMPTRRCLISKAPTINNPYTHLNVALSILL